MDEKDYYDKKLEEIPIDIMDDDFLIDDEDSWIEDEINDLLDDQ